MLDIGCRAVTLCIRVINPHDTRNSTNESDREQVSLLKNPTEGRKQFCSGILPQRFYVFISSEV